MLELVVVEEQQCTQHLSAADDGRHVLEGRSWPGEPGHCSTTTINNSKQTQKMYLLLQKITTYMFHSLGVLPSIAGMSPWSLALLVKGAFCSTTANRGGIRDCRADRNMWSLCSSRPCSPCYRKQEGRLG